MIADDLTTFFSVSENNSIADDMYECKISDRQLRYFTIRQTIKEDV